MNLAADRVAVETRLENSRAARAAAVLEGDKLTARAHSNAIAEAEAELEGIGEAERKAELQWEAAEPARRAAKYGERLAELEEHESLRLAAIERAEASARACASALLDALSEVEAMQPIIRVLNEDAGIAVASGPLDPSQHSVRLSEMLAASLKVLSSGHTFGSLSLAAAMHSHRHGDENWAESERKVGASIIQGLKRKAPDA